MHMCAHQCVHAHKSRTFSSSNLIHIHTQTRTYTYVRASTHTCACAHTHIKDLFIIELDPHRLRRALGGQPFADASLNPGYVVSGICVPPLMPHVVFELYVLTPKP